MLTLGDVLAVVMGVLAFGTCLWAVLVGAVVVFSNKAQAACDALEEKTGRTLGVGFGVAAFAGFCFVVLVNIPNGLFQLIGWVVLAGLLSCACLGASGLALLASKRIRERDKRTRPIAALRLGAGLLVCAGFFPVVGWLVIFPASLAASVGAGFSALMASHRKRKTVSAPLSAASVLEASGFHG